MHLTPARPVYCRDKQ